MKKIKVAYLPLYIKLYDDSNPGSREPLVAYMDKLISLIEDRGIEVVRADEVCRIKEEFDRAAAKFNADPEIAAVITQNLAYSPSLESIEALLSLKAPIVVFDTTPDLELLSVAETENRISANHGIHGVQDLCNLLKRNGRRYELCVGHVLNSGVIDELCGCCRAASAARLFKNARIGKAGGDFEGMGDFRIPDERYEKEIGVKTVVLTPEEFKKHFDLISDSEVENEMKDDALFFDVKVTNRENYFAATKTGLAIRSWMKSEKLDGVTVNFLHADESGMPKMPFCECCKILGRGQGYAGEGDTLTAGLVAALSGVYAGTTFTEMFCPDWKEDILLMSHMGEIHPGLTAWRPVLWDKKFNYNSCGDTVNMTGCYKKGKAVLVNLAPMSEGFSLILSNVEMTDDVPRDGAYSASVQGWMKPPMPLRDYLKAYSLAGGTHHSALVYDANIEEISAFGRMMGFSPVVI